MEWIIETVDLVKIFKRIIALNKVNFKIKQGAIFSFLGPNGAGKTTTVRILSCLLKPTEGDAFVFGENVLDNQVNIRSRIGMLGENPGMYERMTVVENIRFFGSFYSLEKEQVESKMLELLETFNLMDRKDDKFGTLSKGLKQRAALIKTLIHDPELIFLDEPTSGLDPKASVEFRGYISDLGKKLNKTVFMCTHNLVEAQEMSDQVAIIDKGVIKKIGPPSELERQLFEATVFKVTSTKSIPTDIQESLGFQDAFSIVPVSDKEVNVVLAKPEEEIVPEIVKRLVELDIPVMEVAKMQHSLEDVYLKLMGGES
ncbi:MAG TPA: ABC transporter ATP-binding protein [Candidatus Lokiarchaeia archaeon]|nr:ABC transporter ATP-binding protein [Candidatus Lokiarchaeia archaeon]